MTDAHSSGTSMADAFLGERARLGRIVAGMGVSASDGDDILQDVYVKASAARAEFRGTAAARAWLVRVTVNRCLEEQRRHKRFHRAAGQILQRRSKRGDCEPDPETSAIRIEELEAVRRALRELDSTLLAPLVLTYFCDFTSADVGEMLGLTASTVRGRLRDARILLARKLLQKGIEP